MGKYRPAAWVCAFACCAGAAAAAQPQAENDVSAWVAKAVDQFLALEKPWGDDYLDVIAALSRHGDPQTLRRVVSSWEQRVTKLVDDEDPSLLDATALLAVAEGWARAQDDAAFGRTLAGADAMAAKLEKDLKERYERRKAQPLAFRDVDRAIAVVQASPEKQRAELFIEVAWACAESRNEAGMHRALGQARSAAEQFLDVNGRTRIAAKAVHVLIGSGNLAGAEAASSKIQPNFRISALGKLIEAHDAAGNAEKVKELLSQAGPGQ